MERDSKLSVFCVAKYVSCEGEANEEPDLRLSESAGK